MSHAHLCSTSKKTILISVMDNNNIMSCRAKLYTGGYEPLKFKDILGRYNNAARCDVPI